MVDVQVQLDWEWVELILEALDIGISPDEVREFLHQWPNDESIYVQQFTNTTSDNIYFIQR